MRNKNARIRNAHVAVIMGFIISIFALAAASANEQARLKFDCGTQDSPLMQGYERLTAADQYNPAIGYGWETPSARSILFEKPKPTNPYRVQEDEVFEDNLTNWNCDGVASADDLIFRIDRPDGRYRVRLFIGDMFQAIGSIDVYANGQLIGEHVSAWTPGGYMDTVRQPLGWWTVVRETVEAKDGAIRLRLTKNQQYWNEQLAIDQSQPNPALIYWGKKKIEDPPYDHIGWPFIHNCLMTIEVAPDSEPLIAGEGEWIDRKLKLGDEAKRHPRVVQAIELFNAGKVLEAARLIEGLQSTPTPAGKSLMQIWLAGRLEIENERELIAEAIPGLKKYLKANPADNPAAEALEDAMVMTKAFEVFDGRIGHGKNHFVEKQKAIGWFWLIPQDSPLYDKARLHLARACHMNQPYKPTLGTAKQTFEQLREKYPGNRFVRYHLDWEWEQHGDGSKATDWVTVDYLKKAEGAPEWARQLYASYATLIDYSEWWMTFKQQPEGTIGGGWGDDVEIFPLFSYMSYVSRGVSPILEQGQRRFIEGLWNNSEIDPELGFCMPRADAEHTAEWTGNSMGTTLQVDFGNPVAIERAMKTAKLMRDLWTGYNEKGYRQFRANFFSAAMVGDGDQRNDAWINLRALRPAAAVLWYNQHPAIKELFCELADSWVAAAMSTERGKPKGVFPAQIGWPEGILGGVNSPKWFLASHPKGTINADWAKYNDQVQGYIPGQSYKAYLYELLRRAHQLTGEFKYLKPLQLEYKLAKKYSALDWDDPEAQPVNRLQPIPKDEPKTKKPKKKKIRKPSQAEVGSKRWVAETIRTPRAWLLEEKVMKGRRGRLENDITKDDIIENCVYSNAQFAERWPIMTSECGPTDRIAFGGIINPYFIYSGGTFGGPMLTGAVTYENTTKHFAAAVLASDPQGMRILYYSFTPGTRTVKLFPWELEPGGKYILRYGIDTDQDEKIDTLAQETEIDFPQIGTPFEITVKPGLTYVIEVEQTERGRGAVLSPDPGLTAEDIRYTPKYGQIVARVHNVGALPVKNLTVAFYDGDPQSGGELIGATTVPNIEPPLQLTPSTTSVSVHWKAGKPSHEIHVVLDPDDTIKNEITTFNNTAHKTIQKQRIVNSE